MGRERHYSYYDIYKFFGICRLKINDWNSRGFIDVNPILVGGRGKHYFNELDTFRIFFFGELIKCDISRKKSKELVDGALESGAIPLSAQLNIVEEGYTPIHLIRKFDDFFAIVRHGQRGTYI